MMKKKMAWLVMAAVLVLAACGTKENASDTGAASGVSTAQAPDPGYETGNTTIQEGGKKIKSDKLVSFSLVYDLFGLYEEGTERYQICRPGRYTVSVNANEQGNAVCSLNFKEEDAKDSRQLDFTAKPETFKKLQQVLTDSGVIAANGFSATDSALGTYVKLTGEYDSGEKLSVYGEGGASAYPPADIDALIVYLNELAEENGLIFTHWPGEQELKALFKEWLKEILPPELEYEKDAAYWDYDEDPETADVSAYSFNPDSQHRWGAYARYDRLSSTRVKGYYYYPGVNENDEILKGFLDWIQETCPGAEKREDGLIQTSINFDETTDYVQLVAIDAEEKNLWEAYAHIDRNNRTVSDIYYYKVVAEGETEETVYEEPLKF